MNVQPIPIYVITTRHVITPLVLITVHVIKDTQEMDKIALVNIGQLFLFFLKNIFVGDMSVEIGISGRLMITYILLPEEMRFVLLVSSLAL